MTGKKSDYPNKIAEATAWLRWAISFGPVSANRIFEMGQLHYMRFSQATLKAAKARLAIKSTCIYDRKTNKSHWEWNLIKKT